MQSIVASMDEFAGLSNYVEFLLLKYHADAESFEKENILQTIHSISALRSSKLEQKSKDIEEDDLFGKHQ